MTFIFISEHYYPRIGGVTTYVDKTCEFISLVGHKVILLVPGEQATDVIVEHKSDLWNIVYIPTDSILSKNITSEIRKKFAIDCHDYIFAIQAKIDVIHILFGLYLMKYLITKSFTSKGILVGATIHNLPPAECSTSWDSDRLDRRLKDYVRKLGVFYINKNRICTQDFNFYIVPSRHVKSLLEKYIPSAKIHVIGHGVSLSTLVSNKDTVPFAGKDRTIRLLTVAGFVPHKNQHIIVSILEKLNNDGMKVEWHLVGPIRNEHYFKHIAETIKQRKISNIFIHHGISDDELSRLYYDSDIYVQPSAEEGFCLTVLDAAAYGLPIIGTNTGAIPEIISEGSGILVDFDRVSIYNGIFKMMEDLNFYSNLAKTNRQNILDNFKWGLSAQQLITIVNITPHIVSRS